MIMQKQPVAIVDGAFLKTVSNAQKKAFTHMGQFDTQRIKEWAILLPENTEVELSFMLSTIRIEETSGLLMASAKDHHVAIGGLME